ncbi:ABC transporter ATP-binding protein [Desulfobaculum sp. SPO524]|uniref:ABC transporter ATP-binding protein n=1 Tax=Desulfobaculum sp. SPO524 TaxID=3378071 RepID=UPI003853DCA4
MAKQYDRKVKSIPLLKRSLGYFTPYKFRIFLAVISMAIVAACSGAAAYLVKPAFDDIFGNKNEQALLIIPAAYVAVFLIKGVFRYLQNFEMRMCGLKVLETLRNELHDKMMHLPVGFFEEQQVGNLMSRITMDVSMIRNSLPSIVMLIRQALEMVGLICVAFYQEPFLACIALVGFPLAVYPVVFFGKKLRKIGRKNQSKIADINVILQEIFNGIRVVKAFANEERETEKFAKENNRLVKIAGKEVVFSELSSPVMDLVGAVGTAFVMWYGGTQVIEGATTPGSFFSFLVAVGLMYAPVKKLNSANMEIQRALAGAERVFDILDSPEYTIEQDGSAILEGDFKELHLEGVTLHYPGCEAPALDNVTLSVKAGEQVALVGPSGAGKTTLVNMIPRFYTPQSGRIMLNGRNVDEYTLASLRRNIGIVSQDTFLFNASVLENIAYGNDSPDPDVVRKCTEMAYADGFIQELPSGYDTVLGERGTKISGGQKQRLTIARALYKDPQLLILDEATSALDTHAERKVQAALENLMHNRTSIVIAHRLSTILGADKIVVMESGRIVAQGTHAELLESCGLYAQLYNMQFKNAGPSGEAPDEAE